MFRRAAAAAALLALGPALPAGAQPVPARRVVIVWLDHVTLADLADARLRAVGALLRGASVAVLSTRTGREVTDLRAIRVSAAVSFGAGARAAGEPGTGRSAEVAGVVPGLLGESLARAGVRAAVLGDADGDDAGDRSAASALARLDGALPAPAAPSRPDPPAPLGRSSDPHGTLGAIAAAEAGVFLVDPGDTARAARAGAPRAAALARADALVAGIRGALGPRDALMLVAPSPPLARHREDLWLGAVAIEAAEYPPGLLSSGTTRRRGLVSIADLGPTVLDLLGIAVPAEMDGLVARAHEVEGAAARALALERDLVEAARAHSLTTRALLVAIGVVLAALVTLLAGWRARVWREAVAVLLVAAAATPLALYLEGLLPEHTTAGAAAGVAALALGVAVAGRAALGARRALLVVLGATALVPLADLVAGQPIAHRSPLGFQPAYGGRYYGVDEAILGVVVGSALFGAALALGRGRGRAALAMPLAFAAATYLLGAPAFGSKFGAALTAIPAFGVFAVRAGGRRVSPRALAAIAALAIATTVLFVGADLASRPEARSHVGRVAGSGTDLGALVRRKVDANWRITFTTVWPLALVAFAGAPAVWRARRREAFDALAARHPSVRAAVPAAVWGIAAAVAFNDGGVIAATPIALYGSVTALVLALDET